MRPTALLLAASAITCLPAAASAMDGVVASIKPVHSLVAGVMEGVGEPQLLIKGAASPHSYALRPSEAVMLEDAAIVFWIGDGMETFLTRSLETLAADARAVALKEADGLRLLEYREDGAVGPHEHDDERHDHDHDGHDLHIWLDPENAKAMVGMIENALAETDPANAEVYAANADEMIGRLNKLADEVASRLAPLADRPFVVFHDAYHYFEDRFGLTTAGTITAHPDIDPGARRVAEIQQRIRESDVTCVFSEPQFAPRMIEVVTEGSDAESDILDPLGADVQDGPELYFDLIRNMATSFVTCLDRKGRD